MFSRSICPFTILLHLAEDLLSEVFLDVWRQAASFEARSLVASRR
jgi:DNA-directed RNA polymerase specialized sigma24 family protein